MQLFSNQVHSVNYDHRSANMADVEGHNGTEQDDLDMKRYECDADAVNHWIPQSDEGAGITQPYPLRLPTEILQEIFCLSTDQRDGSRKSFRLALVCRRWRTAALGCAKLWSHIVADDQNSNINAIDCLITRSRGTPLEVYLEQVDDDDSGAPRRAVFHCILNELHRIRTLHLSLFNTTYVELEHLFATPAEQVC